MNVVGVVHSLWRYPVKSMRGEELDEIFVGFGGIEGDRRFAFHSSASPPEFPYFTGREQRQMLRFRPRLRRAQANSDAPAVDVETPGGETLAIDDPKLLEVLRRGTDDKHQISLMRSERAFADAFPVSIISLQTVRKLSDAAAMTADKRRFRANIYLELAPAAASEDELVGRSIRIGVDVVVAVRKRDTRCMMITLDPDTAEKTPQLLKTVAQMHDGTAGVYGDVVTEGRVRKGDAVTLLS
jgi:hypothetical protein